MTLTLYNTLSRKKEPFRPIDSANVRMYVCGPTVYDYAHIGNARPIIVFDVLFRLLRHLAKQGVWDGGKGETSVTYVRNITDVDDKINARAAEEGIPIRELTERTAKQFHADIAALGVLPPTHEPRATEHIADMKALIEALVANGHAYVAEDHVLFHVPSMPDYGRLSNRTLEEMQAGARVEVAPYKRDPMDFVLWKPSKTALSSEAAGQQKTALSSDAVGQEKAGAPAWPSPCGIATPGRPGWHIECSAMADKWLWEAAKGTLSKAGRAKPHQFDIHGGGIDLVFPHHENEIAQSRCGFGAGAMANVWMHNGFLQVEGEKMSKSLGNFVTINELLSRRMGVVIRYQMLKTHYRQPIDWTEHNSNVAQLELLRFGRTLGRGNPWRPKSNHLDERFEDALSDDFNTPAALAVLHVICDEVAKPSDADLEQERRFDALHNGLALLGFADPASFQARLIEFNKERKGLDELHVSSLLEARLAARKAKNFKEADRIRDELAAMGIALKDSRDPESGEIRTTWEVAR